MIERKLVVPFLCCILIAISSGGCGKKEAAQEASAPVAPMPQAPAPKAPEAKTPEAKTPEAAMPAANGVAVTASASAEAAMKKSDCFACHAVDKKIIGPAYSWVAYRYKDDKEAVATLAVKVKNGGMGQWNAYTGGAAMTPHAQLSDDEIKGMVEWVLSQTPVEPPKA